MYNPVRFLTTGGLALCALALGWMQPSKAATTTTIYSQTNLVSDGAVTAKHTDENLKNPWGLAFGAGVFSESPFWVANNGTGTSTAYDGSGNTVVSPFNIPAAIGLPGPGLPTGVVGNPTNRFIVKQTGLSGPAEYVFATEDGTISGWNFSVDPNNAIKMVDRSSAGAVYKGLTIAHNGSSDFLYVADFHNRAIDVFDNKFRFQTSFADKFNDQTIPANFAPFNVQNIGGKLYVAYAKQDATGHDDVAGAGNGIVDVFKPDGSLIRRLVTNGKLNSPWGFAIAPSNFGKFSKDLLVGNFGDGKINAFSATNGKFLGVLKNSQGKPIVNDGLWGITFGSGHGAGKTNVLYFAAGLNEESDGLFGSISAKTVHAAALSTESFAPLLSPAAAAAPEPTSVSLILGVAGLFLLRRRARQVR
jgi:uncharacterized protein (TIGR03118 family)